MEDGTGVDQWVVHQILGEDGIGGGAALGSILKESRELSCWDISSSCPGCPVSSGCCSNSFCAVLGFVVGLSHTSWISGSFPSGGALVVGFRISVLLDGIAFDFSLLWVALSCCSSGIGADDDAASSSC